jgi:hypothetical protein
MAVPNVQAYGASVKVADHSIFMLPGEAMRFVAGFGKQDSRPCLQVAAVLPPKNRHVPSTYFREQTGESSIEIPAPPILWVQSIFDTHPTNASLRESLFQVFELKISKEGIHRKAYQIGNVNAQGKICWGGSQPLNMKEANLLFWGRYFSGAYSPGLNHKCKFVCSPQNDGVPRQCEDPKCKCCHGGGCDCGYGYGSRYKDYIKAYTGDFNPYPWEDFVKWVEALKSRNTWEGPMDAFYYGLRKTKSKDWEQKFLKRPAEKVRKVFGWAREDEDHWDVFITNEKKPLRLEKSKVTVIAPNKDRGGYY